jgi:hypothetical protein
MRRWISNRMTQSFDKFYNSIMEKTSPEEQTQEVMLSYGKKLRTMRDKLMNCSSLDKTYQSYRKGFVGIANDFLNFYDNRKAEIEKNDNLSSVLDVILKLINDTDPRFNV